MESGVGNAKSNRYCSVSTEDQNLDRQKYAKEKCLEPIMYVEKIFSHKVER